LMFMCKINAYTVRSTTSLPLAGLIKLQSSLVSPNPNAETLKKQTGRKERKKEKEKKKKARKPPLDAVHTK